MDAGLFPLAIFPEGSLASSVITTVWVGVFVVAFFNLRLGWVLSGLVVPGYMVPLMLVKPAAAAVVFCEGVAAYGLVWFYSEFLARYTGWSNFFGRDRFFALVLASTLVRVLSDGYLLPIVGEHIATHYVGGFDYRNNLHSFGLIIVSLIANNFWKTGFWRGIVPMAVTVGLTLVLVRFGLMELTNFNLANTGYLYEDIAASVLASPKAYIILITTAFIASRINLFYGWDYAGILIPSLLALQWYQPMKIVASLVEATVILVATTALLRLPMFQRTTVEGARKLLLFFNVSFAYKLALGYALLAFFPQVKITDAYGFGYLLPTLMAIKMHDKDIYARLTRATLQTSLVAVGLASLIGFAISFVPDWQRWNLPASASAGSAQVATSSARLLDIVREEKLRLYLTRVHDTMQVPLPQELDTFDAALARLQEALGGASPGAIAEAAELLGRVGYRIELVDDRYLVLREGEPRRGWGTYVLNRTTSAPLMIQAPSPLDERAAVEAAAVLFEELEARALAIPGAGRDSNRDRSSDVLANHATIFHTFHRRFARGNVLQVRAYTPESSRVLAGERRETDAVLAKDPETMLWVKRSLPAGLAADRMRELAHPFEIKWDTTPFPNIQRESQFSGFAELFLGREGVRRVLSRALLDPASPPLKLEERRIEGYLQAWMLESKSRIAEAGTNDYRVPRPEELLYFDEEVLVPLITAARSQYRAGDWTPDGIRELRIAAAAAAVLGYEVIRYRHRPTGQDYVILAEKDDNRRPTHWGTLVIRLGETGPYVLQVPRPLFELNTFEYGVTLFERLGATALAIGGAHPHANLDYTSDIIQIANKANLFNLFNQVLLRESGNRLMMVVQSRAFGPRQGAPMPSSDVVLAFDRGGQSPAQVSLLGATLLREVGRTGARVSFADGTPATSGYEVGGLPQSLYLTQTANKEFAILWISPFGRAAYRQQGEDTLQKSQFLSLGIDTIEEDLARFVARRGGPSGTLPKQARELLASYQDTRDVVLLHRARVLHPELRFERLADINTQQAFLVLTRGDGSLAAVVNLNPANSVAEIRVRPGTERATVDRFLVERAGWLLGEGPW